MSRGGSSKEIQSAAGCASFFSSTFASVSCSLLFFFLFTCPQFILSLSVPLFSLLFMPLNPMALLCSHPFPVSSFSFLLPPHEMGMACLSLLLLHLSPMTLSHSQDYRHKQRGEGQKEASLSSAAPLVVPCCPLTAHPSPNLYSLTTGDCCSSNARCLVTLFLIPAAHYTSPKPPQFLDN